MSVTQSTASEIAERAREIYERDIRPQVANHRGKRLLIDVSSGDYEVGENGIEINERLRGRRPDGIFFGMRIGYRAADKIGGSWEDLEE